MIGRNDMNEDERNNKLIADRLPDTRDDMRINLSDLGLTGIPEESIKKLLEFPDLFYLSLSNNNITTLPESFGNLKTLEVLYLFNNNFSEFPSTILQLENLKKLNMRYNGLTALPDTIDHLKNLEMLFVCDNNLTALPTGLSKMRKLTYLSVMNNQIPVLPHFIGRLLGADRGGVYLHDNEFLPEHFSGFNSTIKEK